MTWHAKALTTSYVTAPRAGSHGREESDAAFPFTTTSWYFLDAVDVVAAGGHGGRGVLRRFDHRRHGLDAQRRRSLARRPVAPPARGVRGAGLGRQRRHRRQSRRCRRPAIRPRRRWRVGRRRSSGSIATWRGCRVSRRSIWLEGINDLSGGARADAVIAGMREVVQRSRAARLEDLRRDDRLEPRQRHARMAPRRPTPSVRRSTRSSAAPGRSTASSTSTWRRAIRRPAACARRSSPTARPADLATGCTRTGPAIRRWATPSTSVCSRRSSARR